MVVIMLLLIIIISAFQNNGLSGRRLDGLNVFRISQVRNKKAHKKIKELTRLIELIDFRKKSQRYVHFEFNKNYWYISQC